MSEQEFEKDSLVSKLYHAMEKESPPVEADREILVRAYDMKASKTGSSFPGGWKIPLSLAAVLVIGLAVVLRLGISPQRPLPETQTPVKTAPPVPAAEPAISAPAAVPVKKKATADAEEALAPTAVDVEAEAARLNAEKPTASRMKKAAPAIEAAADTEPESVDQGKALSAPTEGLEEHVKMYGTMDQFMKPEYWEQEIRLLFMAGEKMEALKQFRLFRDAFPEYDASDLETMLAGN